MSDHDLSAYICRPSCLIEELFFFAIRNLLGRCFKCFDFFLLFVILVTLSSYIFFSSLKNFILSK